MPTIAARQTLNALWPLLHSARDRTLTEDEIRELRRLCETLPKIPNRDEFNNAAEEFCLMMHSSGVFDSGGAKKADRLLSYVDELRGMLDAAI